MLSAIQDWATRLALGFYVSVPCGAVTMGATKSKLVVAAPGNTLGIGADGILGQQIVDGVAVSIGALTQLTPTIVYIDDNLTATAPTQVQAADTTCYYLICRDAAGTAITAVKGKDGGGIPMVPAGVETMIPFAVLKVVTVAVTFSLGVTLFDASGVTTTCSTGWQRVPSTPVFSALA